MDKTGKNVTFSINDPSNTKKITHVKKHFRIIVLYNTIKELKKKYLSSIFQLDQMDYRIPAANKMNMPLITYQKHCKHESTWNDKDRIQKT